MLCQIFRFSVEEDDTSICQRRTLALSRVCGHWRAVAVADTALWASISLSYGSQTGRIARLFAERSGSRTLTFLEGGVDRSSNWLGEFYATHLPRVRKLAFFIEPDDTTFVADEPIEFRELVRLTVSSERDLPTGFWGQHLMPKLRELQLESEAFDFEEDVTIAVGALPFSHLSSISLTFSIQSLQTLLAFLRNSPAITYLSLDSRSEFTDTGNFPRTWASQDLVHLNSARTVMLSFFPGPMRHLLSAIALPHTVNTTLRFRSLTSDPVNPAMIFASVIGKTSSLPGLCTFTALEICQNPCASVRLLTPSSGTSLTLLVDEALRFAGWTRLYDIADMFASARALHDQRSAVENSRHVSQGARPSAGQTAHTIRLTPFCMNDIRLDGDVEEFMTVLADYEEASAWLHVVEVVGTSFTDRDLETMLKKAAVREALVGKTLVFRACDISWTTGAEHASGDVSKHMLAVLLSGVKVVLKDCHAVVETGEKVPLRWGEDGLETSPIALIGAALHGAASCSTGFGLA